MKKALLMAVLVAFAASTSFAAVAAKSAPAKKAEFSVGAGIAIPEEGNLGFGGEVAGRYLVSPNMGIGVLVGFHTFSSEIEGGDSASAIEILASGKIKMGKSSAKPYILAGVGFCNSGSGDYSSTDIEIQPGLGVEFGAKTKLFVQGKLSLVMTEGDSTTFIPISVGLLF